jgi:general secretion pathway protein D
MKTKLSNGKLLGAGLLILLLGAAIDLPAQQRGTTGRTGGGGFGGFGGFGAAASSSSSGSSYNNNGTVGSAIVSVDPETHNLVVIADAETALQISNVIANLDIPKPQALIKVVFMEVQHNNSADIGIEGGWSKGIGNNLSGSAANVFGLSGLNTVVTNLNGLGKPFSTALSPSSGGPNGIYQLAGSDFQATLRAIAASGKAQILSRPSILARDGQVAKIVVGQEAPLPTSVSYATSGNSTIPIVNVTYTDIGIILNVTPFIGNGLVEMIIQPRISSVSATESQTIAPDVSAPYLDVRSADTVVVTPDAQTIVIGGLISNSKNYSDSKVPLLGDIPLLGMLFKSSSKNNAKKELLIFLTPHIIQSPTQLAGVSGTGNVRSRLVTDSFTEKELNQFIENLPAKKK